MINSALLKAVWEQSRGFICFISVLAFLSVGLFAFQTLAVNPDLERLQYRQAELQKQLNSREAKLASSGVPVSTVERMEKELLSFAALVPAKEKFAEFVGDLFSWADQTNLDIRQVSYRPETDNESTYLTYSLNFSVQGTYAQLKKFIHLLENSKRILIIDQISMMGRRDKGKSSVVNLRISLTTLFQGGA